MHVYIALACLSFCCGFCVGCERGENGSYYMKRKGIVLEGGGEKDDVEERGVKTAVCKIDTNCVSKEKLEKLLTS